MTEQQRRLARGGRLDRGHAVRFCFDGRGYSGFAGDTLASALLANGISLVGRSFKYHRPRGFLSAGIEEPNGLFTLGDGAAAIPNIQGTTLELVEGLQAHAQNAWPSVGFDCRSAFGWLAPLLRAGFYYKTFMGPRRGSWMLYERFIRRSAGLGRVGYSRDEERFEVRHAYADVVVIGAGPAGLAAAVAAASAGSHVMLIEQDWLLGGHLLTRAADSATDQWRSRLCATVASFTNLEVRNRATTLGVYDGNTIALVERPRSEEGRESPREAVTTVRADAIIYATGAIERPLVFADNDRPGVMLASAVLTYLQRFAVKAGDRVLVATNNDSAWGVAAELAGAGCQVVIADSREDVSPAVAAPARGRDVEILLGAAVSEVGGRRHVRGARLRGRAGASRWIACDLVAMSGGWTPTLHLTSHTGSRPVYDAGSDSFVPGTLPSGHFVAGSITGPVSLSDSVRQGAQAGLQAARHAGARGGNQTVEALLDGVPHDPTDNMRHVGVPSVIKRANKAFVDFQNDVTVGDIQLAQQEGFEAVEHLKRYTTLGMGTDQGKTSNINGMRLMAEARGSPIAVMGTTTFRPPFSPVSFGALAGRSVGQHFRPIRRSALHEWHESNGAAMTDAGLWRRAWYYGWAGANVAAAYIVEMRHVRTAVGICDISTLGKIDVQGPDAAVLLNRVYVNGFAKLPVGKSRYGVMLNDDGTVLDDGTTTRLTATRYFMTTTTAQAGEVMSWLEFLLQTAWTELRVHVVSLTDEWGAMSIAGPRSREVLVRAFPDVDVSDAALPYMGCLECSYAGVPIRILRLSFSGELAFEVYVPAHYSVALWEHFLQAGAALNIKPYGLEALAALRIEKGHVAGLELDQRTTLDDLGLGRMAAKEQPYVGRMLRSRPALQAPERWSLVGIECVEPGKSLRGGAILFRGDEEVRGHGRGYITSVTWSPELDRHIALGLFSGGLKNEGLEIVCAFPLLNEMVRARIVKPVFIDREGVRLRA